jgi:hypothetical protein
MLNLTDITKKSEKDLLPAEKTELRRNVRSLTVDQQQKYAGVLSQSDPNIGEDTLEIETQTTEND